MITQNSGSQASSQMSRIWFSSKQSKHIYFKHCFIEPKHCTFKKIKFKRASNIRHLTIFTFSLPIEHNLDNTLFFFFFQKQDRSTSLGTILRGFPQSLWVLVGYQSWTNLSLHLWKILHAGEAHLHSSFPAAPLIPLGWNTDVWSPHWG